MKTPANDRGGEKAAPARPPARRATARPVALQRLQAGAGNKAVAGLLGGARSPGADPKFAALTADVAGKQKTLAAHPPATAEAAAAQAAAKPPQDDKVARGKAANAEKMNAAKPGDFDRAGFVKAVNDAIAAQAPKNLDEAQSFGSSGKADAVAGQVSGRVGEGKKAAAGPIESTTKAPPDTSKVPDKPVIELRPDAPPPTPAGPNPANAVPDPLPPAATDLSAGPREVDGQLAAAEVTEQQLATSNEPEFTGALAAKKEGEAHAATAPGQLRAAEAGTLAGAKASAAQTGAAALTAMAGQRRQVGAAVAGGKATAKGSDEARRAQVTATLQKVFDATKAEVEGILSGLDKKVDDAFRTGEQAARAAFTAEHSRKMAAYKEERYSGLLGKGRWLRDKFADLPAEANQIFVQARAGYVARMQQVIVSVADLIGVELGKAKQRIAQGREQLQAEVTKLPKELQGLGRQAAAGFAGRFDELAEGVTGKGQELVQTLAAKYTEAVGKVDEEIAAEKEKNKGLISKAVDAVGGVIKTILELKDLLLGVLAKAASAVMSIIKDPIGFLGKLVSAVGAGLHAFLTNIGKHLKQGLLGWLLGAMSSAGVQLPAKFDLRGIIGMIASLLGLTWSTIRGRITKRGVPDQAMTAVEQTVPVAQQLQAEGPQGIWQTIAAKVGDLKENLFGKLSKFLIPTVLIAGITWIISLLNPASAFVKACKMIVDIVSFIVERGAQIVAFVNAVLDAVIAIAGGGAGGVPDLIEKALAMSIPVLIGALAAILGVGGIASKVKGFIQSLSKPVMKAVDWVVDKIVGIGKKLWAKMKGRFGKKDKTGGATPSDAGREQAAITAADRMLAGRPTHEKAAAKLPAISKKHGVPLTLVVDSRDGRGEHVHVQTMSTGAHTLPTEDELSNEVLLKSIEAMRKRTGSIVGKVEKLARKVAAAGPLQAPAAALVADLAAEERGIAALLAGKDRPTLLAARDRYTAIDRRAETLNSDLSALGTQLEGLTSVHQSSRNAIQKVKNLVKKGTVKKAMTSGPGAAAATEWAALEPLYTAAAAAVDRVKGSGDLAQVTASREAFTAVSTRANKLVDLLEGLQLSPAELAKEQERVFGLVDRALAEADGAMADPEVGTRVFGTPDGEKRKNGLTERIKNLREELKTRTTVRTMAQLRQLADDAGTLARMAADTKRLGSVKHLVDEQVARINNVENDTTLAGRPDSTIGEGAEKGTSEAALKHEIATGEPHVTREGHWMKVETAIDTLKDAVAKLKALEPSASGAVLDTLKDAKARAERRQGGLETGLAAWKARASTHGALWNDDPQGSSKVLPSWPAPR